MERLRKPIYLQYGWPLGYFKESMHMRSPARASSHKSLLKRGPDDSYKGRTSGYIDSTLDEPDSVQDVVHRDA